MVLRSFLMIPVVVLVSAALGMSVLACGDSVQQEALTYNQTAVAALHKISEAARDLENSLVQDNDEQPVDGEVANAKLSAYQETLESGREEVAGASVPDLDSAREFSSAIEEYFQFHSERYLEVASEAVEVATSTDVEEEQDQAALLFFGSIAEERSELWDEITRTQQTFADEVDITLEERE